MEHLKWLDNTILEQAIQTDTIQLHSLNISAEHQSPTEKFNYLYYSWQLRRNIHGWIKI